MGGPEQSPHHSRLSNKSSLEELLFYKGQPSLFYRAQLKKPDYELHGSNFPAKLVKSFSMAQLLCGALLVIFGAVGILTNAALAYLGGGIWSGALICLTGTVGMFASANPRNSVLIVAFLVFSLFSVAASSLVIVLSATGLASDASFPDSFYVDEDGKPVDFTGQFSTAAPAVASNSSLLIVAIISCLLSLGSCILSAKEACQCYSPYSSSGSNGGPHSTARRDRLLSWLGQQAILNTLPPLNRPSMVGPVSRGRWPDQRGDGSFTLNMPGSTVVDSTPKLSAYKKCSSPPAEARNSENKPGPKKAEKAKAEVIKVDDKYTAVDKRMAEEYIEKLLVIDEKRTQEMYEIITKDALNKS